MLLLTSYYRSLDENRNSEFEKCLNENISNANIEKIILLAESECIFSSDKIVVYIIPKRPTFADFIKIANKYNGIKIVANSDIYFNSTLSKLENLENKQVVCLTRWDLLNNGEIKFYQNYKSQDSWIFINQLPENIGQYYMGSPGCDNRFAGELNDLGFDLINPSLSIQSVHLHASNFRTYNKKLDRIVGRYYYPLPNTLKSDELKLNTKVIYWLMRRKYYRAVWRKTLEGYNGSFSERVLSFMKWLYFRGILKLNNLYAN